MSIFLKSNNQLDECSACKIGTLENNLFTIDNLPLVDSFCKSSTLAKNVNTSSVTIRSCSNCKTLQIDNPVKPEILYENYIYESSTSPDLESHFEEYANDIKARVASNSSRLMEIGINDGLLAFKLINKGFKNITGVDPSPQAGKINNEYINVYNSFFGSKDTNLALKGNKYEIIIANNVLSHIPDMQNILENVKEYLSENGTFIFEVQSVRHLLENHVFDYIYHEHIFYHSLISLQKLLEFSGLEIIDLSIHEVKGGSYRIFASHKGKNKVKAIVKKELSKEILLELNSHKTWNNMKVYLDTIKTELRNKIEGHHLCVGYGASATSTVLQRYFELEKNITYIIDDNVKRQGLFSPGYGIPIVSDEILSQKPLVLVLAWRHVRYFQHKLVGLPKMVPLPTFKYE
jgi:SAM-dependent methyltransferase